MNRDIRSLCLAAFTLLLGVLTLVLTTSVVWPIVILVLGGIGLIATLITPARES
ncbi:hypothetical protein ACWCW7_05215 [Nocardia tengchongensis]